MKIGSRFKVYVPHSLGLNDYSNFEYPPYTIHIYEVDVIMNIKLDYKLRLYLDILNDEVPENAFDEPGFIDIYNHIGNDNTIELIASDIISEEATIEDFIHSLFNSDNKAIQDWLKNIYKRCSNGEVYPNFGPTEEATYFLEHGIIVVTVQDTLGYNTYTGTKSYEIPKWIAESFINMLQYRN